MSDVDVAALESALRQVIVDLANRPLSGSLVLAYWLVMTNVLMSAYAIEEPALTALFSSARALRVQTADPRTVLN